MLKWILIILTILILPMSFTYATDEYVLETPDLYTRDVSFDSVANKIYFCGSGGLNAFDLKTKQISLVLPDVCGYAQEVDSKNQKFYESTEGIVKVFDLKTKKLVKTIDYGSSQTIGSTVSDIAVDTIRNKVYLAREGSNHPIIVLDGKTHEIISKIHSDDEWGLLAIAVNEKTGKIYFQDWNGYLLEVDPAITELGKRKDHNLKKITKGGGYDLAIDSDRNLIYALLEKSIVVSDLNNGKEIERINISYTPNSNNAYPVDYPDATQFTLNTITGEIYYGSQYDHNIGVIARSAGADSKPSSKNLPSKTEQTDFRKPPYLQLSGDVIDLSVNRITGVVYVCTDDGFDIIDGNSLKLLKHFEHADMICLNGIVSNPITNLTYVVTNTPDGKIWFTVIDKNNKIINKITLKETFNNLILDEKSNKIYMIGLSKTLYIFNTNTNKIEKSIANFAATNLVIDQKTNRIIGDDSYEYDSNSFTKLKQSTFYQEIDPVNNLGYVSDSGSITITDLKNGTKLQINTVGIDDFGFTSKPIGIFSIRHDLPRLYKFDLNSVPKTIEDIRLKIQEEKKKTEEDFKKRIEQERIAEEKSRLTYSDETIGFSFKYPHDWKLKDVPESETLDGNPVFIMDEFDQVRIVLFTHVGKFTPMQHLNYFDSLYQTKTEITTNRFGDPIGYATLGAAIPIEINGYYVYANDKSTQNASMYLFTNDKGAVLAYVTDKRDVVLPSFKMKNAIKWNSNDYNLPNYQTPYRFPSWLTTMALEGDENWGLVSLVDYLYREGIIKKTSYNIIEPPKISDWHTKLFNAWKNNLMSDNDFVIAYQYMIDDNYEDNYNGYGRWPQKDFTYDGSVSDIIKNIQQKLPKGWKVYDGYLASTIHGSSWTTIHAFSYQDYKHAGLIISILQYDTYAEAAKDLQGEIRRMRTGGSLYEMSSTNKDLQNHCVSMVNPMWDSIMCGRGNMLYSVTSIRSSLDNEELIISIDNVMNDYWTRNRN